MHSWYRRFLVILLLLILCPGGQPAGAQTSGQAVISNLVVKRYPEFSFKLDVYDASGQFLSGLKPARVSLLEDELERPLIEMLEERRNVETLVVVNAAQALGLRDARGVTRYDVLRGGLQTWLNSLTTWEGDTYSLLNNQGQEALNLQTPVKLWEAIDAFKPDMRAQQPSMDSLTRALTVAEGAEKRRVVLFITPLLQGSDLGTLQGLAEEAKVNSIRLSIWMAGGTQAAGSADAQAMEAAAVMTGGSYFAFSGSETIPNPSTAFDPLAGEYLISYRSGIITSGSHTLALRIEKEDGEIIQAAPLDFTLIVRPPNPIFLSPPPQIQRSGAADENGLPQELTPVSQTLKMVVEFPDAHPRALRASRLFVDQRLVVENKKEPFDTFTWPLTAYEEDGRHMLRLEVEDEMGLMGSSSELPVSITIALQMPEVPPEERLSNLWGITAAILAFAALATVLVVGWTIRSRSKNKKAATADMMTENPVETHSARGGRGWPKKGPQEHAEAAMMGLEGAPTFNLGFKEATFGRDPTQATCVVTAVGVDALHCRLKHMDDGSYWLYDENSVAGTWVNYAPLGKGGIQLQHGDRVAIGQAAFRFQLQNPRNMRRIQVKPYKDRL